MGGYLPFTVDLTSDAAKEKTIRVAVRLDNRNTNLVPPGKPIRNLDFTYPGGLYRGVKLIVTDLLHITDSVYANTPAGGGIYVSTEKAAKQEATLHVETQVINESNHPEKFIVIASLRGMNDREVAKSASEPAVLDAGQSKEIIQYLHVMNPNLWSPDHPVLYRMRCSVQRDSDMSFADTINTNVGIRRLQLTPHALLINGVPVIIRGSNRHQEYPYVEYAMSPEAAWRDARKIKDAGFNFIRMSHYPQYPAFIDACDKLGIMVMVAMPGWQIFHNNSSFIDNAYQNIRDMIRLDRNHPSVVFWETALNETEEPLWFHETCYKIAHEEMPGDQCFTFGQYWPGYDVRGLWREYGDWNFGGNESTSRQFRGDGEQAMLQQTWNFLWTLNNILAIRDNPKGELIGAATWVMFDYNRGYYWKQEGSGMMDIFRLPKFVYYFYQSQRDPSVIRNDVSSGPMVFIANYWTPLPSPAKVIVFSNCQEVELKLNGHTMARQQPDNGPDTPYSSGKMSLATTGSNYDASGGSVFDGGNCKRLEHPPFTFMSVPYEEGTLEAIGYINGKPAAKYIIHTPQTPASLKIVFDTAGKNLTANGSDAIFVRALVLDKNGTVIPNVSADVTFKAKGDAHLIGANPLPAEAGIASILLQAGLQPGNITVTVSSPGLKASTAQIESRK
jgi:beta-galactosidase